MKYLHSSPLPEAAATNENTVLGQQLAKQGLLDNADAVVTQISSDAADLTLDGQYRWGERISTMLATELDELGDSGLAELPLYQRDGGYDGRGYYAIEEVDVNPLHANRRDAWQYSISLVKEGTRTSYRRAIETAPSQENHPFGNDQTAYAGVPATASQVQWYDADTRSTSDPTLVATRNAELGDVEIYDAQAAPYDDPSLVYAIAYDDEGPVDVRVWDERGLGAKTDTDGVQQWQKVFATGHDFEGEAILDNGLIRLRFDEATPALSVERWDDVNATWSAQALGTSDWEFFDLDVREVGLASVKARVEFRDPVQSPTAYYTLNCWVKRGWTDPLWGEIDGEGGTPTGLVDLLNPVSSGSNYEPGESKGLVDRGEL